MEILPRNTTCLDLSIAIPGFSSSPSFPSSVAAKDGSANKLLDINQAPSRSEEECMEEEEDEEENPIGYGPTPRKKLRLTKEQSRRLEQNFLQNPTLNPKEKEVLAMELRLKPRQVEVWFQNRRARSKMKQTEIEREYLKRWFGALTEQNRRLQKEVEELRSMKAAPPVVGLQPPPVSALTMCPRCERITTITLLDKSPATTTAVTTSSSDGTIRFLQRRRSSAVSNK